MCVFSFRRLMIEALTLAHLMARSLLEMPHYVIQVNNAAYLHRYHRFVEYAKNVYQIMLLSLLVLHLDLMTLCHTQLFFLTPLSDRRGANEASTLGHCRAGTVP